MSDRMETDSEPDAAYDLERHDSPRSVDGSDIGGSLASFIVNDSDVESSNPDSDSSSDDSLPQRRGSKRARPSHNDDETASITLPPPASKRARTSAPAPRRGPGRPRGTGPKQKKAAGEQAGMQALAEAAELLEPSLPGRRSRIMNSNTSPLRGTVPRASAGRPSPFTPVLHIDGMAPDDPYEVPHLRRMTQNDEESGTLMEFSITIVTAGSDIIPPYVAPRLAHWMEERCDSAFAATERGTNQDHLHYQAASLPLIVFSA